MNRFLLIILLVGVLVVSCRVPFDPDIEANKKVLVVDGFLSNKTIGNYIKLSYAVPYDSTGSAERIHKAEVYLTDNTNKVSLYKETRFGYYEPEDNSFAGVLNRSYILTVILPNGEQYDSSPQLLLPILDPDSVYGGFNKEEHLVVNNFGVISKVVTDVCDIYYDIKSDNNEMPRFRFTSSQLIEYDIYRKTIPKPPELMMVSVWFYCWMTEYDNSLRFTNEKYTTSSVDLVKQTTCVTTPSKILFVRDMDTDSLNYTDSIVREYEYNRIISINQYRLNADAFRFYKGIEIQSKAEGKIFDPIISQLYGNMKCKQDSLKLVLGFFEVSSVSTNSYSVRRNGLSEPILIKKASQPVFPSDEGFTVDTVPKFWIKL